MGYESFKVIEIAAFESLDTVSYSLSIVTMALSCIISETKPNEILVENRDFFILFLHPMPQLGYLRRNVAVPFGAEN